MLVRLELTEAAVTPLGTVTTSERITLPAATRTVTSEALTFASVAATASEILAFLASS